ncbi:hypothetical protein [Neobacillus sp. D3-1R]|uniref:hypothetical protein n=1 Tax=Neobacillus sp. D3-1R TaxID=3445778 RepID=UPI003FA1334B
MLPWIFIGLALFFGVFWFSGNAANILIIYVIGLTGMGVFLVLTSLTISKQSNLLKKAFETEKNYPPLLVKAILLFAGIGMLFGSIRYWQDVPFYQDQNFSVISGKPSSIDEYNSKGTVTELYVEIKGHTFVLDADMPQFPKYKKYEELLDKHFTILYLPNSNWIIDYKVE